MLRLLRFRGQLVTLWHAFRHPATPLYLKALMVGVVIYLFSPVDFLPDIIPIVGWIDDALLVAFAVNWIISRLPADVRTGRRNTCARNPHTHNRQSYEDSSGTTIEGTARRL